MSSFVLLADLANSLATGARPPLTALSFETAMAAAIWIVAGSYERRAESERNP